MRADEELVARLEHLDALLSAGEDHVGTDVPMGPRAAYVRGMERGMQLSAIGLRLILREIESL